MTLDEYTAAARPLNPDYTDAQIAEQYHSEFPTTPVEAKAMPTLEEYTAAAKPLNPDYSDEQIAEHWQSEFGAAGARKEKPGFLEAFGEGAKQGAYDLGASGAGTIERLQKPGDPLKGFSDELGDTLSKTAEQYHPSRDLSQEPWYTRLRDPEYLGNLLGNVAVQSAPALGGAAVGGLLGGPAGAAAGMTAVTYFQQAGSTYREALERHKKDGLGEDDAHEKAYTESGIAGLVSGVVNSLAVPATLAAPFTGVIKNLATKYILNIGVDAADQVTQNLVEQKTFKPEQELTAGLPEAIVGSAVLGAPENIAVIKTLAKPKEEEKPDIHLDQAAPVLAAPNIDIAIQKAGDAVGDSPITTEQLDAFIGGQKSELDITVGRGILDAQTETIEQERLADQAELVDALKQLSPEVMGETTLTTDELGNTFFNGSPVDVVHPTALPETTGPEEGMSKEKYEVLSEVATLFGKRVVVYKESESMPEGMVLAGGNSSTIFMSEKTQSADLFSVFSHEALHLMEGTEFHSAVGMTVWENLTPEAKQLAIDRHGDLSHDDLISEMVSDIGGTELHKPEVWEKVYLNLNEKVGEEQAKTQMLSFIDQIKTLIKKVTELIASKPWATGFGKNKKTYAEQYVTDLTKVHDALAAGVANAIYQTKTGIPGQGKIALAKRSSKASRTIVHPDTVKAFTDLAKAQRGKPESAMFDVQEAAGGGVLGPVVENVGDLIHRMTEQSAAGMTQSDIVMTKIDKSIGLLSNKYGFEKEHNENLRNNARAGKKPVAQVRDAVDKALLKYAAEHKKLPVYNEAQHLAREASVAVGEKRFGEAVTHLKALKKLVSSPNYEKSNFEYTKDGYRKPEAKPESKKLTIKDKKVDNKSEEVDNPDAKNRASKTAESAEKEEYDYASTQINLPAPLAKRVLEIGKQIETGDLAEKGLETVPHITIKYGLHSEDPKAVSALLASDRGVTASIGDIGMFATDDGDVLVLKVVSPDLVKLNEKISTLPNTTEFEYKPHITIAYVKKGLGKGYVRTLENPLEGQSISVDEIQFSNKKGEFTPIPLNEGGPLPSFGHRVKFSKKMTDEDKAFAKEYDDAPIFDKNAAPAWESLKSETERLYTDVVKKVTVERVTGEPYPDAKTMNADIAKGSFKVTTDHSEHPVWSVEDNFKFRVVHDYIGHFETGFDFTLEGEKQAYEHHAEQLTDELSKQALKVEVYGQAAAGIAHDGVFQPQKIFLPKQEVMVKLEHYSKLNNLKTLDPKFQGTGQIGAEQRRMQNEGKGYLARTYLYRAGTKPEPRFKGQTKYTTSVKESELVDLKTLEGTATERELAAKKAGFKGFYNSESSLPNAVALFEKVKVEAPIVKKEKPAFVSPKFSRRNAVPTYPIDKPGKLDYYVRLLQDKFVDVRNLLTDIEKAGGTVPEQLNPVLAEEMFQKRDEQRAKDFTNDELRPLVSLMKLNKVTVKQLDEYLHARHVIDDNLNARLQAINPDLAGSPVWDKLSGITDAEARKILSAANKPVMDILTQHVDDMVETTRELMVHYGLEKQKTIDDWRQSYKHYVPLRREGFDGEGNETGMGKSVRGSTVKQRGGSGLAVENILANIAQARDQIVTRGEKNRVTVAMAGLQMLYPNPAIATLDKPATITYVNPATGLTSTVPGNLANYEVPTIRRFNPTTGKMQNYPDPTYKGRDNVVNFRIKGEDYAIVFNENTELAMEVAKAFKNLGTPQLNGIMKAVAPYTRYLAAVNTQYNPIFGLVNFVRDAQFAMLTLSSTPLSGKQATIFKNAIGSLAGIYADARAVRKGGQANSPTAQLWRRFEHVGGPTGYRDLFFSASERAEEIERMMNPSSWKGTYNPQKFGKRMEETYLFKLLSDYNLMMENSIRLGVFKTAVDTGMSDLLAASYAKNITVNFNKKGQIGAQMGSLYAFFNANVQGTARIAETLFERTPAGFKISAVGKKIIVGGLLVGMLQTAALALGGFDDDDPPEFVKQKNLVIPVPGTEKGYAMLPMPLGFNLLPNVGRLVSETMMNVVKGKPAHPFEKGAALLSALFGTLSPLGGTGGVQEFAPTVGDPFVAITTNRDWTGKTIAKEDHSALDPSPGHTRAHNTATAWAKALSYAINWATGGTDYVPGQLSPSPDTIDYLVEQATGGVGREFSKGVQVAQSAVTGEELPTHKIPLVGRFVGSATGSSSVRNRFFENVKASNMAYREFEGRALHHETFSEYVQRHPEARFAKAAKQVQDDVAILNKQKAILLKGGASREAIRLQEERITGLMNRFNLLIERAQEQAP